MIPGVTSLEPYSVCLEIIGGMVFTSTYLSLETQTVCYKPPSLFPELPEDLAQRIFEG